VYLDLAFRTTFNGDWRLGIKSRVAFPVVILIHFPVLNTHGALSLVLAKVEAPLDDLSD
jgi:hypothetical protein